MSTTDKQVISGGMSTGRLEAFSDGVFAIAITLLVLNIQVPQLTELKVATELPGKLFEIWPTLLSYALSFVVVGIYWVAHHNTFHFITHSDRTLLWINLFFLMCVSFIPFPAALLGRYGGQQIVVAIYGGTLVMTGVLLQTLWWYVTSNHHLVDKDIAPGLVRLATRKNLTAPLIYLLAIAISFISVKVTLALFVLVPLIYIFPSRIDIHWRRADTPKTAGNVSSTPGSTPVDETPHHSPHHHTAEAVSPVDQQASAQ